jgi:hypothetical protein
MTEKTIHQTWITDTPPSSLFRPDWIQSWRDLNPNWDYKLWTDFDIHEFVKSEFPQFYPIWCAYPRAIMRVDAWRYLLLKKQGGLYVDLDSACLRPLDAWLTEKTLFCCGDQGDGLLSNSLMWAPERNMTFFEGIEDALMSRSSISNPVTGTGSGFLSDYCKTREKLVLVMGSQLFSIPHWERELLEDVRERTIAELYSLFPESNAISFWIGSWVGQGYSSPRICKAALSDQANEPAPVMVVVLTSDNESEMANAVKSTWGARGSGRLDVKYFDSVDSVRFEHGKLTGRQLALLFAQLIEENAQAWFFFCDERCYVDLERLRYLPDQRYSLIGHAELLRERRVNRSAGYLLSRDMLIQAVASTSFQNDDVGDAESVLFELIFQSGSSFFASHKLRSNSHCVPGQTNEIVSAGNCPPNKMRVITSVGEAELLRVVYVAGQNWQDRLAFYDNGLFVRGEGFSFGSWEEGHDAMVVLKWDGCLREVFVPMRDDAGDFTDSGILVSPHVSKILNDLYPVYIEN